jgi:hypothetical protein
MLGALAISYLPAVAGRPSLFALGVTAIVAAGSFVPEDYVRELFRSRNVYGVSIARETRDGAFTDLYHGTTRHGTQYSREKWCWRGSADGNLQSPLSYFHMGSPIGEVSRPLR